MILNLTKQTVIAKHPQVANTPFKRMKGLLGRSNLPLDHALIIPHCQSVHMVFMQFPIDVVFIDRHSKVVGLTAHLKPFAFSSIFWKSACAIELPTGTIAATATQVGDQLSVIV